MKKILLTTFLMLICMRANATMVVIDYQGDTLVQPQTVERNLIINSDDGGVYNIAIKPLDDALRNSEGTVEIPLSNVYINNTREDVYLRYNEYSTIFDALSMGGIAKNMIAKIRDYGMVPAGAYNMGFEVQATDPDTHEVTGTSIFNLQFIVPVTQQISLHNEIPRITIGADDAFNKSKRIVNEISPMIYINSNCDWELSVNTDDFGESAGNYYIRTVSASNNVNERLQERVLLQPNKEIIIAKGKAPANNEFIAVEYSIESKDGEFIKSGNYENRLKYILREIK